MTPVQNNFTSAGKHHCSVSLSWPSSRLLDWSPLAKKEDVLLGVGSWSFLSSCGSTYAKKTWCYVVNSPSLWGDNHTEQLPGRHWWSCLCSRAVAHAHLRPLSGWRMDGSATTLSLVLTATQANNLLPGISATSSNRPLCVSANTRS